MLFSEHFNVTRTEEDDWLDIIVDADTRLWVDPFLIFRENSGNWITAHDEIIAHFQTCFELIVQGNLIEHSVPYRKALALLAFKEPREFCLGYTEEGTGGSGGGPGYAKAIARAMVEAINRGLSDLDHFEELGILDKGIGPDRISDLACNILKSRFIEYTKAVAARHGLATKQHKVKNASYDAAGLRWQDDVHSLPTNPSNGRPILLTPQRFIHDVPVLNAEAWFEAYQAEQLRLDVNYEVLTKVDKTLIVQKARQNVQSVRDWTEKQATEAAATPYDLEKDPKGVYGWDPASRKFVKDHPIDLPTPSSNGEFLGLIEKLIDQYRRYVEQQGGWALLWNDDGTEKYEEAAQLLFMGVARTYCSEHDINVDREVELGRGPVDFKFSNGAKYRVLLELKKLTSGKFWQGLESQLPTYLEADDCEFGWYIAVQYKNTGVSKTRAPRLAGVIENLAKLSGKTVKYGLIDARRKPSASNVKKDA